MLIQRWWNLQGQLTQPYGINVKVVILGVLVLFRIIDVHCIKLGSSCRKHLLSCNRCPHEYCRTDFCPELLAVFTPSGQTLYLKQGRLAHTVHYCRVFGCASAALETRQLNSRLYDKKIQEMEKQRSVYCCQTLTEDCGLKLFI